jgi:uncharacterized protein YcaQ
MSPAPESLSAEEARRVALSAQGLRGARPGGGVVAILRRLGAVQLDTISVLARSHELVAYTRLGAVGRARVERAYWGKGSATFEFWSHAACVLPLEDWPAYAFKRRHWLARGKRWHRLEQGHHDAVAEVRARLVADGPLTANELGGAKRGGPWWDWSESKVAAEWLLDIGEVVCRERRGFQRVYDLAERAVPDELRARDWSDEECAGYLVPAAARALGVGTEADIAVYHGVPRPLVRSVLSSSGLVKVAVEGWQQPGWADPAALASLGKRAADRSVLLSPFDSLIWHRDRVERLFGLRHRLEAYTPKAKRQFGYFAMPVLGGTKLVGLVDPGRDGDAFVAKQVTVFDAGGVEHVAHAILDAALWVGSSSVTVGRVKPTLARTELLARLASAG